MWTELEHFYSYRDEAYKLCNDDPLTIYERVVTGLDLPPEAKCTFLGLLVEKKLMLKEEVVFEMAERMIKLEDRFTS